MMPQQKLNLGLALYLIAAAIALIVVIANYNGPVLEDGPPRDQPTVVQP